MKKNLFWITLLILTLSVVGIHAEDSEWLTDFEKAKQLAAEKNLPILVDFSGSDWCGWCIRLKNEVWSKDVFKTYAKENLILFVADFPRMKKLPEKIVRQNETLARKYGIRGLPTVLIMKADGTVLAKSGYRPGGADAYIEHIEDILKAARKSKDKTNL